MDSFALFIGIIGSLASIYALIQTVRDLWDRNEKRRALYDLFFLFVGIFVTAICFQYWNNSKSLDDLCLVEKVINGLSSTPYDNTLNGGIENLVNVKLDYFFENLGQPESVEDSIFIWKCPGINLVVYQDSNGIVNHVGIELFGSKKLNLKGFKWVDKEIVLGESKFKDILDQTNFSKEYFINSIDDLDGLRVGVKIEHARPIRINFPHIYLSASGGCNSFEELEHEKLNSIDVILDNCFGIAIGNAKADVRLNRRIYEHISLEKLREYQ